MAVPVNAPCGVKAASSVTCSRRQVLSKSLSTCGSCAGFQKLGLNMHYVTRGAVSAGVPFSSSTFNPTSHTRSPSRWRSGAVQRLPLSTLGRTPLPALAIHPTLFDLPHTRSTLSLETAKADGGQELELDFGFRSWRLRASSVKIDPNKGPNQLKIEHMDLGGAPACSDLADFVKSMALRLPCNVLAFAVRASHPTSRLKRSSHCVLVEFRVSHATPDFAGEGVQL